MHSSKLDAATRHPVLRCLCTGEQSTNIEIENEDVELVSQLRLPRRFQWGPWRGAVKAAIDDNGPFNGPLHERRHDRPCAESLHNLRRRQTAAARSRAGGAGGGAAFYICLGLP